MFDCLTKTVQTRSSPFVIKCAMNKCEVELEEKPKLILIFIFVWSVRKNIFKFSGGGNFCGIGSTRCFKIAEVITYKSGWDRLYLGYKIDIVIVIIKIQKLSAGHGLI